MHHRQNGQKAGYIFSFIAFCVWPLWVPCVCLILHIKELSSMNSGNRYVKIRFFVLIILVLVGLTISIILMVSLFSNHIQVDAVDGHIVYHFNIVGKSASSSVPVTFCYLLCTTVSFSIVSDVSYLWMMSITVGIAAAISYVLYSDGSFPSTWCFFAAWVSLLSVFIRWFDIYKQCTLKANIHIDGIHQNGHQLYIKDET